MIVLVGLLSACGPEVSNSSDEPADDGVQRHFKAHQGEYILGGNPQITLTDPHVADEDRLDLILAPNVYPADEELSSKLRVDLASGIVEFDASESPELRDREVGDIVISRDFHINWRRIVDIERRGDTVVWKTETSELTDVIQQGEFYYRVNLTDGAPPVDLAEPYLDPDGPTAVRRQASTSCWPVGTDQGLDAPYACGQECPNEYTFDPNEGSRGACVKVIPATDDDPEQRLVDDAEFHCQRGDNDKYSTASVPLSDSVNSKLRLEPTWVDTSTTQGPSEECLCFIADWNTEAPKLCDTGGQGGPSGCEQVSAESGDKFDLICEPGGSTPLPAGKDGYCTYCEGEAGAGTTDPGGSSNFLGTLVGKLSAQLLGKIPLRPKAYFKIQPDLTFNVKIKWFKVRKIELLARADFLLGLGLKFLFQSGTEYEVETRWPSEQQMGRDGGLPTNGYPLQVMGLPPNPTPSTLATFYIFGYPFAIAFEMYGKFSLQSATDLTIIADYKYYTTRNKSNGEPKTWTEAGADWNDYSNDSVFGIDADQLASDIVGILSDSIKADINSSITGAIEDALAGLLSPLVGRYDPNGEHWYDAPLEGPDDPVIGAYVPDGDYGLAQGFALGRDASCKVDGIEFGPACTPSEAENCDQAGPNNMPSYCPCDCIKKSDKRYQIRRFNTAKLFNVWVDGDAQLDIQAEAGAQIGLYDGVSNSRLIFLEPVNLFLSAYAALQPPYCGYGLELFYRAFIGFGPIEFFGISIIDDEFRLPLIGLPIFGKDWTLPEQGRNCYAMDDGTTTGLDIHDPDDDALAETLRTIGGESAGGRVPGNETYASCPSCQKRQPVDSYRDLNWLDNSGQCRIVRALATIGLACGATQSDYDPAPAELCSTDADCAGEGVLHPRCAERFCVYQPDEGMRISLGWVPDTELDLTVTGPAGTDVSTCQRVDQSGYRHLKNAVIPAAVAGAYEIRVSDLGGSWDADNQEWTGDCQTGSDQLQEIEFTVEIEHRGVETKTFQGRVDRCALQSPVSFRYVVDPLGGAGGIEIISAPSNVQTGQLESDDAIVMFQENTSPLVLTEALEMDYASTNYRGAAQHSDALAAGFYEFGTSNGGQMCGGQAAATDPPPTATIPSGVSINSHYLHFDPVGDEQLGGMRASHTFDGRIIGISGRDATLLLTNDNPGHSSTTYPTSAMSGFGLESDPISVDSDGRTLTVDLRGIEESDALRVVTECVDDRSEADKCAEYAPDLYCGPASVDITNRCGLSETITCGPSCPRAGDNAVQTSCNAEGTACECAESSCDAYPNEQCNAAKTACECSPLLPTGLPECPREGIHFTFYDTGCGLRRMPCKPKPCIQEVVDGSPGNATQVRCIERQ